ncbi:MAG: sigma-70 family RNA polymerase sigma factor [Patulibacter minatonensis]
MAGTRTSGRGLDLEAAYAEHGQAVLIFLTRRTADPEVALDLWAETFAVAFERRDRYRGTSGAEAGGWLYGIARNQLRQFYRRGTIEQRALGRLHLERPPATPEVLDELQREAGLADLRSELRDALAGLSPATRDAVRLRVVDELDYPTVAERLGVSEGTARVRVSRGLAALADLLDHPSIRERTA